MASLLDIAPMAHTVLVCGVEIPVTGISARGFVSLIQRFPELHKMLTGQEVDQTALLAMAPDALAAFIAAGTGKAGDEQAEAVADALGVDDQLSLALEIIPLTFPKGVGPFVARLTALGLTVQAESVAAPTVQPKPSPAPSNS